jgi:altronate hydrolase
VENRSLITSPDSTGALDALPISDFAIVVDPRDNLAVVKREFVLQFGQPIGTSLGISEGAFISHDNMTDDVPSVRALAENLFNPPPDYFPESERSTFMGFRRPDGRVGTRNFVLIVPTSMCASHEAQQISTIAEFVLYNRDKYPNVDGVVAIPHNKGCGCQDGSTIEVMLRTLANYADHPNVGGVVLIDLGCEKTNLAQVERFLLKRERPLDKPVAKIGIQEAGGTQAACFPRSMVSLANEQISVI